MLIIMSGLAGIPFPADNFSDSGEILNHFFYVMKIVSTDLLPWSLWTISYKSQEYGTVTEQ